jgi:PAS domain S-box-containing protein
LEVGVVLQQLQHEFGNDDGASDASMRSELEVQPLLESLPNGAYACDATGLITYFNRHAAEIWGRAPELRSTADRYCGSWRMFAPGGDEISHDRCAMAECLRDDRACTGNEVVIERPDGSRVAVQVHANPIHDGGGRLTGAVNVFIDVTEQRRTEARLGAEERGRNEFIATLAHELRNPLAPIRNVVEVLQLESGLTSSVKWGLEVIDRQLQRMTRLVDDLLDLARVTNDKLTLHRRRIDVRDVLQLAVETSRPQIQARRHHFVMETPSQPIALDGDLTRLSQAISNLLDNAVKYTPPGGHIGLSAEREGSDAVIRVSDTGSGIASELRPRIFDMFAQGADTLYGHESGLGVGLTLARRLVEMHGGSIDVRSDGPGSGSEFVVRVPASVEAVRRAPAARVPTLPLRGTMTLRILVVDDNHDAASSLGVLLESMGNDIEIANDGLEALRLAQEFRPDVILLDIGLPGLNGYEVARHVRGETWGKHVLLVAVSGWGQVSDRERSDEAGIDRHLVKPLDFRALLEILDGAKPAAPIGV